MGLQINTNVAAMNAYRNLASTQGALATSLQRLSSGLRINSAADDAAGLAVSQKLQAQVTGLQQASQNAQDGISLLQTAEGALGESQSILQRIRQLAVQSANDTNTASDRTNIQKEVTQLTSELDRISSTTEFNTRKLLDGTASVTFQIGANAGQTLNVAIGDMSSTGLAVNAVDVSTQAGASSAITSVDAAIDQVSGQRADLGAYENRLQHTVNNLGVAAENLTASRSRITDTDMAQEMTNFTRANILQQAGVAMLAQANQMPQAVLKLLG